MVKQEITQRKLNKILGRCVKYIHDKDKVQKIGRFTITTIDKCPYTITNVFIDKDTKKNPEIKADLEKKNNRGDTIPIICIPLNDLEFYLDDEEKRDIKTMILRNNLDELFNKYWFLSPQFIENFIKKEYTLNNPEYFFEKIENIGKNDDKILSLIRLFINIYDLNIPFTNTEDKIEKLKNKNISFIFFNKNRKINDIYLDKTYNKILFIFDNRILLIQKKDRKKIEQEMNKENRGYKINFQELKK